ncbi:MAG: hypothetical protein JW953_00185 [Anaerolineae bacterium]|nr:hypothetical protein [Anaerolineae bacterium]
MTDYYYLPLCYGYGNNWQMNFWDAVYYLAVHQGLPIRVTTPAIVTLMAGQPLPSNRYETLRHHFMSHWKAAVEAGELAECTPDSQKAEKSNTGTLRLSYRGPGRVYLFDLPGYHPHPHPKNNIIKPRGYIENGWSKAVSGVYAKRLLNFLFSQNNGRQPAQSSPAADVINEFQAMAAGISWSIHPGRVKKALRLLVKLGLVNYHCGHCCLNLAAFAGPPPSPAGDNAQTGQIVFLADWLTAQVEDRHRANLAGEIVRRGAWSPLLFWRIYNEVRQLSEPQQQRLCQKLAALPPSTGQRHRLEWTYLLRQVMSDS